jgi:dihydrofolate reductase
VPDVATSYFTASSVDGFVADPEHSLSWLLSRDVDVQGPMGYERFFSERVGAMLMGSTTYRWLLDHLEASGEPWPYDLPCWVLTTRPLPAAAGCVRFARGDVAELHPQVVAAAGGKDVWVVGGGDVAGQLADAGLLDDVWVQFAPVTLGGGAPLLPRRVELRLEEVARNRDFACARWSVVRPPAAS